MQRSAITVGRSGATYHRRRRAAVYVRQSTVQQVLENRESTALQYGLRSRAVQWGGEWAAPSGELETLVRESCPALAAMRFIRVPIWRTLGDSTVMLGDVRYGGGGNGFADVRVPRRSAACPRAVPPWTPPRADLLGEQSW
jgi:hypothetical protein